MRILNRAFFAAMAAVLVASSVFAQASNVVRVDLAQAEIDRIITKFTENEEEFRYALTNYVFNRSATVQTIGLGGNITGTYRRDSFMTFTEAGERFEKITYFPMSTLTELQVTPEDLEDLGGVNPFALDPRNISMYTFRYLGKEKIDELDLYVFDVTPKVVPDPKKSKLRLFTGRIWVDDQDLMIVKSKGKGIPEGDQRFPIVETWRDSVDGKYWFPVYTASDDELVFKSGQVVKIRLRVRYENYKQGRSEVIILDEPADGPVKDDPAEEPKPLKPGEVPPPPPPPPGRSYLSSERGD